MSTTTNIPATVERDAVPVRVYRPDVDVLEREHEVLVLADMPGARAEAIDIRYEAGTLTLQAPVELRAAADRAWLLREYGVGEFRRSFEVGESLDTGRISAEYADGVLTIHLPKVEAVRPRTIPVRTA